jgi:elongation factor P
MSLYNTNQFRAGLKIIMDGAPCSITFNEFVKPGKGQAFSRVKYRNLLTGRILEKTFKSGESVPAADVREANLVFLYQSNDEWVFVDESTYEQHIIHKNAVGDAKDWLIENAPCMIVFWNDQPIEITPETFVNLRVIECEPAIKGDTVSGATKEAKLETGKTIRVPLFVEQGDLLKIDTRNGEYASRAKD